MIKDIQKGLMHIYKAAAQLPTPVYRAILLESSGHHSAADPEFTQTDFDHVMASLEAALFDRVHRGLVDNPIGKSRHIRNEFYWRRKLPDPGKINSRQYKAIVDLWEELCPRLDERERTTEYFAGIVAKATGRHRLGVEALAHREAGHVINALRDRLTHAIRKENVHA